MQSRETASGGPRVGGWPGGESRGERGADRSCERRGPALTVVATPVAALGLLLNCGWTGWSGAGPGCEVETRPTALTPELEESSGVAVSVAHPGVFWTHNDGSRPILYAVDREGRMVGRTRVPGLELRDWEDLERADCDAGSCLYLADTGDNDERRDRAVIYRIPEPEPGAERSAPPDAFPVVFPDGPRDVEALFVLPGERLYLVSKGRHSPVSVYAYPGPLRSGPPAELVEIQRLSSAPVSLPRMVTGASAAPDGNTVVIRTYEALHFYQVERVEGEAALGDRAGRGGEEGAGEGAPAAVAPRPGADHHLVPMEKGTVNLHTLQEPQGEGVALGPDGLVVLTSEDGPGRHPPQMAVMRCRVGG